MPKVGPIDVTINLNTRWTGNTTVSAPVGSAVGVVPKREDLPDWTVP